ncbi:MAG: NAD+ synthase [Gammaproteobacteria bacterium]
MSTLRIGLAQSNCVVGDVAGNTHRVLERVEAFGAQCDLIVFPELMLVGYPADDLLLHPDLESQVHEALNRLREAVSDTTVVVGHPEYQEGLIYNACSVIGDGQTYATYRKRALPHYGAFHEKRYFAAGSEAVVVDIGGVPIGLSIGEDAWRPDPIRELTEAGARLIVNVNASPYCIGKRANREQEIAERATDNDVPFIYLNMVGGQDNLVFDGHSFAVNKAGEVVERLPGFEEDFVILRVGATPGSRGRIEGRVASQLKAPVAVDGESATRDLRSDVEAPLDAADSEGEVYKAIELAVRDYIEKNGFEGALVGLSGGVDSALTLTLAVDALGAERVTAVLMPSRYTSDLSVELAKEQVKRLGVKSHVISIEEPYQAFLNALKDVFAGLKPDMTEENIQARCRGTILMAISNKTGRMVLATGNKSESAVGYATLYGDTVGGFSPLKDVSKTLVYKLARYRNRQLDAAPIPEQVLTREPSAELSVGQKDTDSLPPYPVLDAILAGLIENEQTSADLVHEGFDSRTIEQVAARVKRNEYKRHQGAPGVKISTRAFGLDRCYPITSGFAPILPQPAESEQDETDGI